MCKIKLVLLKGADLGVGLLLVPLSKGGQYRFVELKPFHQLFDTGICMYLILQKLLLKSKESKLFLLE